MGPQCGIHGANERRYDVFRAPPPWGPPLSAKGRRWVHQVTANPVKHGLIAMLRREKAFHILHHEDWRAMLCQYLEVLHIESLPNILIRRVVAAAVISSPAYDRVSLAGRPSD
jgi:hypothetical protein